MSDGSQIELALVAVAGFADAKRLAGNPNGRLPPPASLPGTGIVDHCHPDLMCGTELIEVKMSRTIFRLADLQQLLVYTALAWLGTDRKIERVTLTNPVLGVAWSFELRELIREISDLSLPDFCTNG